MHPVLKSEPPADEQAVALSASTVRSADYTFNIGHRTTRFVPASATAQQTFPGDVPVESIHLKPDPEQSTQSDGAAQTDGVKSPVRPSSPEHPPQASLIQSPPNLSIDVTQMEVLSSATLRSGTEWESDMEMSSPTSPGSPTKLQASEPVKPFSLISSPKPSKILSPVLPSITFRHEALVSGLAR